MIGVQIDQRERLVGQVAVRDTDDGGGVLRRSHTLVANYSLQNIDEDSLAFRQLQPRGIASLDGYFGIQRHGALADVLVLEDQPGKY